MPEWLLPDTGFGMQTWGRWGRKKYPADTKQLFYSPDVARKEMSLHNFTTKVQQSIIFDPKFTGIKAKYSRRTENKEGDVLEDKSVFLYVSPQGNYVATDKERGEIGVRVTTIWAKAADLQFDGKPFLPEKNDIIEYTINGVFHRYIVSMVVDMQIQSSFGQKATFSYEDGLHGIIRINTIRKQ